MTELILFWVSAGWFKFYLINHAAIFSRLRAALAPLIPCWLKTLLKCPLCVSFWGLILAQLLYLALWLFSAASLFVGFIPLAVICPPAVLFVELAYQRLKNGLNR